MRLLLAGCGHAHLFVLEALRRQHLRGFDVVLVSPDAEYFYSGMIPGVIAGCYPRAAARFRPPLLARAAGAEWIQARVARLEPERGRAILPDGRELGYDVVSLDIGAGLAGEALPGVAEHAVAVKPMRSALRILSQARSVPARPRSGEAVRIVVAGGGAAGVELSLCLDARLRAGRGSAPHRITIVDSGDTLLAEYPPAFRARAARLLAERGIEAHTGLAVEAVEADAVRLRGAGRLRCDAVLWATGARAPRLVRDSGLQADEQGYLLVRSTLQSLEHPALFGAGDCVVLERHRWLARAGVYAVRQAPVLVENLGRHRRGEPLLPYRPQRHWLSLLNTGDGRALASYRGRALHGRAAWWLKDRIDRRFVARFQRFAD